MVYERTTVFFNLILSNMVYERTTVFFNLILSNMVYERTRYFSILYLAIWFMTELVIFQSYI